MPISHPGTRFPKEVPMLRSRSSWIVRLSVVLMGFCLILPYFETAEAATRSTSTKKSTTARVSQSSAKRVTTLKKSRVRRYSPTRASARRARLARAKAVAYARDMRVLQTPQYRTDANGMQVPDVRAEAAIIYNPVTHEILW